MKIKRIIRIILKVSFVLFLLPCFVCIWLASLLVVGVGEALQDYPDWKAWYVYYFKQPLGIIDWVME